MRQRTQRRKRKRAENAVVRGDEPPDPITLATSLATTLITTGIGALGNMAQPKASSMTQPKALKPPTAGAPTKMTYGERANLINTTPQGIFDAPSTARSTLLGN